MRRSTICFYVVFGLRSKLYLSEVRLSSTTIDAEDNYFYSPSSTPRFCNRNTANNWRQAAIIQSYFLFISRLSSMQFPCNFFFLLFFLVCKSSVLSIHVHYPFSFRPCDLFLLGVSPLVLWQCLPRFVTFVLTCNNA